MATLLPICRLCLQIKLVFFLNSSELRTAPTHPQTHAAHASHHRFRHTATSTLLITARTESHIHLDRRLSQLLLRVGDRVGGGLDLGERDGMAGVMWCERAALRGGAHGQSEESNVLGRGQRGLRGAERGQAGEGSVRGEREGGVVQGG